MTISGLTYIPDFITEKQEQFVLKKIDEQPWSNELKRRVQHYGYKYNYTFKSVDESMKVEDLTDWMKLYGQKMVEAGFFTDIPDQAIINEYLPGQGIYKHIDCQPCFKETIASLSLGSGCTMEFTHRNSGEIKELYLEPKSLLVLTHEARYHWLHGIPAHKSDNKIPRDRRVSVTFRNVILTPK